MEEFRPSGTGTNWQLSAMLQPLSNWKNDILVISGVDNEPGNKRDEDAGAGAHFQQTASFLSCVHIDKEPFRVGVSIDQVAAESIGYVTPHRSLQLSLTPNRSGGTCGGASWPCQYLDYISWADATTPLANRSDPVGLFQILFGGGVGVSEEEFEERRGKKFREIE